jgi:hypothetical protein
VTALSRRSLGFGGVIGILVVAAVMGRVGGSPADEIATSARRAAPRSAAASATGPAVDDVRLELLQKQRTGPQEAERNPFRFESRAAARPAAASAPPIARPVTPSAGAPSGPPPPPSIPLRFIGLLEAPAQAGRVAILSDGRGNVFYGRDGDIIEGRYKVLKIDPDAAELSFVDGHGRQTIRLTGQ